MSTVATQKKPWQKMTFEERQAALKERETELKVVNTGDGLPPIKNGAENSRNKIEFRPEIIVGLLRKGSKALLSGSAKARKTWCLMDLGISVSQGGVWLGFETKLSRVLYINFELHEDTFRDRLENDICPNGFGVEPSALTNFDYWTLKGYASSYAELVPQIKAAIQGKDYGLVIIDPTYKMLGDADENKATDVAKMLNAIEQVSRDCGVSLMLTHHFTKGGQAMKNSGERGSGSGVFLRDPEAIIEFVEHEESKESDAFTIEFKLREFKPINSFGVRWSELRYRFHRDNNLEAGKHKGGPGAKKAADINDVEEALRAKDRPMKHSELATDVMERSGCSESTAKRRIGSAIKSERITKNEETEEYSICTTYALAKKGEGS
jgi:hypothetical protein